MGLSYCGEIGKGSLMHFMLPNEKAHRREAAAGDARTETRAETAASRSVQRPGSAIGK